MSENGSSRPGPTFVILRLLATGHWEYLGEFARKPGRPARAARRSAIVEATRGKARSGEVHAAILRGEWRVAQNGGSSRVR